MQTSNKNNPRRNRTAEGKEEKKNRKIRAGNKTVKVDGTEKYCQKRNKRNPGLTMSCFPEIPCNPAKSRILPKNKIKILKYSSKIEGGRGYLPSSQPLF